MIDFNILRTADILPSHFAKYYSFKRVSVSMWMNGRAKPHRLHEKEVAAAVDEIKRAVDLELLPIPKLPRSTRYQRTVAALSDIRLN